MHRTMSRNRRPSLTLYLRPLIACGQPLPCPRASGVLLFQLGNLLSLDERSRLTAVFLLFASQMFYATTAHIANDCLALPLFLLVLNAGLRLYAKPSRSAALLLG